MLKTGFLASVVSFLWFCPWNEQWKPTKSSWLTFSVRVSVPFRKWYAERDAEIENEKLRREVEELRQASEADLLPGTIEYERHRLTRAQADAQELKNASETGEVIDTAFATYALSKLTGEVGAIIDSLPLAICRQFPGMEKRYQDFIKMEVSKAFIRAYQISDNIPDMAERYIKDNQRS